MRVSVIRQAKTSLGQIVQASSSMDISRRIVEQFVLHPREPLRRKVMRLVAHTALDLQQPVVRKRLGAALDFSCDLICIEDRFANDASLNILLKGIGSMRSKSVLIPGCFLGGEDVQFWLRRGVKHLEGVDVYSLKERWDGIVPALQQHYGAKVSFGQASIESLPFADKSFDLVATSAVLEHVRNLPAMVDETARVLKPGGWAWHCFGPLYYAFGGDHCIAAYGDSAGYDHLLLDEADYQKQINDQSFFDKTPNPNLPFWAKQEQFSFATASEYLSCMSRRFQIEHAVVILTTKGLAFRRSFPQKWARLLDSGVAEHDLLIKSLALVLRSKEPRASARQPTWV